MTLRDELVVIQDANKEKLEKNFLDTIVSQLKKAAEDPKRNYVVLDTSFWPIMDRIEKWVSNNGLFLVSRQSGASVISWEEPKKLEPTPAPVGLAA